MTYDLPGYDIINLGRGEPVMLLDMVQSIQKHLGKSANLVHTDMQIGDVPTTLMPTLTTRAGYLDLQSCNHF